MMRQSNTAKSQNSSRSDKVKIRHNIDPITGGDLGATVSPKVWSGERPMLTFPNILETCYRNANIWETHDRNMQ